MAKTPKRQPNTTVDGALACAFGEPLMGPHPLCDAETERACRDFGAAVAAGTYDAEGYTPLERAAQTRRLQADGRLF